MTLTYAFIISDVNLHFYSVNVSYSVLLLSKEMLVSGYTETSTANTDKQTSWSIMYIQCYTVTVFNI